MKYKNIKKLLFKNLIFCGSFSLMLSISGFAINNNLDITRKSIIESVGGLNKDYFRSAIGTSDGGIITVGYSNSTNAGFINKGSYDAIVVKYNKDGNQEWIKNFGGSDIDCFISVVGTSDGGIVTVGYSSSTDAGFINKGSRDAIIVKYSKNGSQEWIKNFGGSDIDSFSSVVETKDGGFIAVGDSRSTDAGFLNNGTHDAITVKYDKDGNQIWIKNFGGDKVDEFNAVISTRDGGIIAVGKSFSINAGFENKGDYDAIIVKYNKSGNQEWVKNFGGSGYDYFKSVIITSDEELICAGHSDSADAGFENKGNNDAIIVKYDKNGNQLWVKNFGGSNNEYFNSIINTSNGEFITVGYSTSIDAGFINKGGIDAIMVKYNKNGSQEWARSFGGLKTDYFFSIIETSIGEFVIVGYSNSADAGFTNKGDFDAIMLRYNPDYEEIFDQIEITENTKSDSDIKISRTLINKISEGVFKEYFQDRLNQVNLNKSLDRKNASANLDIYVKCENVLMMSLDTNNIIFEDFSGVEDMIKENAINITVSSSLPYSLNAYLPTEIQNSDKSNTMNKDILNIKENSEANYKEFTNTTDKLVLKDNCPAGNDLVHGVDIKLKGGIAHQKDVYKTTIKFEAEQK